MRAQIREWGWSSWIGLPLVVEGCSVGLIELVDYTSSARWSPRDVAFAQTIASQAAMAVRNAQLYENLRMQVVTDALTGLLNHRAFYEREQYLGVIRLMLARPELKLNGRFEDPLDEAVLFELAP